MISQLPDETVKNNPAFQAEKSFVIVVKNQNALLFGQSVSSGILKPLLPKAIVYVPFLQETEQNNLNPINHVNPVEIILRFFVFIFKHNLSANHGKYCFAFYFPAVKRCITAKGLETVRIYCI